MTITITIADKLIITIPLTKHIRTNNNNKTNLRTKEMITKTRGTNNANIAFTKPTNK